MKRENNYTKIETMKAKELLQILQEQKVRIPVEAYQKGIDYAIRAIEEHLQQEAGEEESNGLNIIIKEVNDVSERWVDFIKDNFTPKSQIDKERKEALEALLHVITDIEMLRTNTWEPDDDSCNATTDNLKLVIKYIEKTKRV